MSDPTPASLGIVPTMVRRYGWKSTNLKGLIIPQYVTSDSVVCLVRNVPGDDEGNVYMVYCPNPNQRASTRVLLAQDPDKKRRYWLTHAAMYVKQDNELYCAPISSSGLFDPPFRVATLKPEEWVTRGGSGVVIWNTPAESRYMHLEYPKSLYSTKIHVRVEPTKKYGFFYKSQSGFGMGGGVCGCVACTDEYTAVSNDQMASVGIDDAKVYEDKVTEALKLVL